MDVCGGGRLHCESERITESTKERLANGNCICERCGMAGRRRRDAAAAAMQRRRAARVKTQLGDLRALLVEDNGDDAELLEYELRRAGYQPYFHRVDTMADLARVLDDERWDIVISDFRLVGFTALEALGLVQRSGRDLPFIIVSGFVGEETAVDAMKAGAHDFFLKNNLTRLGSAIERELREAQNRRQRQDAVDRVAENERRLRAIFEQTIVGIAQTDLSRRITDVNERFCRITGRSRDELVGMRVGDLIHPDDRQEDEQRFVAALAERSSYTSERRYVGPNGEVAWVTASVSIVVDQLGEPAYAVKMVEDISDRKKAEDDLKRAVSVRDEFMSMASHELKTPVTALELGIANCERLAASLPERSTALDKLKGRLEIASQLVDRLTALVGNLLDVTRITSGRLTISPEPTDLRVLVKLAADQLRDVVERSGSSLRVIDGPAVIAAVDRRALETVISNLISNAAKYGRGKPIEINIGETDATVRVEIRDEGLGIAEADLKRIFGRFERAVLPEHYGGLGIGLWIVRNLIEAHGGQIEVTSRANQGSTFRIELPRKRT